MKHIVTAPFVALVLACTPVDTAPNAQLAASVQPRLAALGFTNVDTQGLSRLQLSALHLKLTNRAPGFGLARLRLQQEVKVILGWDSAQPVG